MAENILQGLGSFAQGFADTYGGFQAFQANQARLGAFEAQRKQAEQEALMQQRMYEDLSQAHAITDPRLKIKTLTDLAIKYPTISTKLNESSKLISSEQKDNVKRNLLPAYNALAVGKTDIALQKLTEQEQAFRNAGDSQQADQIKNYIESVKNAPDQALTTGTMYMMNMLGVDEFKSMYDPEATRKIIALPFEQRKTIAETLKSEGEAERQPFLTQEAQAKAMQEGVKAKYAESQALLDLENKGWNIKKLKNDIDVSRQNARIAAMNASINAQGNEYKKQELQLKMQDAIAKRDDGIRAKAAEIESARSTMDNTLNTVQRILNTPYSVIKNSTGTIASKMPTVRQSSADLEALVETLKSQAFMAQIPNMKGLGQLSNAEGDKLQSSMQNLSLSQSPERLLANVKEIERLVRKGRRNISLKYGVPDTEPDVPSKPKPKPVPIPPRPAGAVKPLGAK